MFGRSSTATSPKVLASEAQSVQVPPARLSALRLAVAMAVKSAWSRSLQLRPRFAGSGREFQPSPCPATSGGSQVELCAPCSHCMCWVALYGDLSATGVHGSVRLVLSQPPPPNKKTKKVYIYIYVSEVGGVLPTVNWSASVCVHCLVVVAARLFSNNSHGIAKTKSYHLSKPPGFCGPLSVFEQSSRGFKIQQIKTLRCCSNTHLTSTSP